jgi:DNA helicase MCM9
MLRDEVLVMDAVVAITLMECSLNNETSFFGKVNILHTGFPLDPETEYADQGNIII